MTADWKAAVVAELERRDKDPHLLEWYGRARAELARQLGVDKSAVTKMLQPRQGSSEMVPRVSKILDLPMPVLGTDQEIAELVAQLDEGGRRLAVELLRRIVK